jgi:NADH-quinone oxidoreductase subunit C
LSSPETTATDEAAEAVEAAPTDERREAMLARFTDALGDALVQSHMRAGDDLWLRVTRDAWGTAAEVAKRRLGFDYFDFLSAIDWLPSPFGRDMDAQEDAVAVGTPATEAVGATADEATADESAAGLATGYAGGDTRFQMLARVVNLNSGLGVTLKADLPDDDLSAPTWTDTYLGANWHEREAWEMFGITFVGHPGLVHLYLPGAFEGHPLRKDFPLLSRRVKPWPGIVDVEPLPGDDAGDEDGEGDT